MLRQTAAIILLLAFSVQIFDRALIILDYYTRTASYAAHCENKRIPTMHCNGKCQMMKKLKAEEKKDQQNPARAIDFKNEMTSSKSFFPEVTVQVQEPISILRPRNLNKYPTGTDPLIFHPPV